MLCETFISLSICWELGGASQPLGYISVVCNPFCFWYFGSISEGWKRFLLALSSKSSHWDPSPMPFFLALSFLQQVVLPQALLENPTSSVGPSHLYSASPACLSSFGWFLFLFFIFFSTAKRVQFVSFLWTTVPFVSNCHTR